MILPWNAGEKFPTQGDGCSTGKKCCHDQSQRGWWHSTCVSEPVCLVCLSLFAWCVHFVGAGGEVVGSACILATTAWGHYVCKQCYMVYILIGRILFFSCFSKLVQKVLGLVTHYSCKPHTWIHVAASICFRLKCFTCRYMHRIAGQHTCTCSNHGSS